jgi:hypothetical protein
MTVADAGAGRARAEVTQNRNAGRSPGLSSAGLTTGPPERKARTCKQNAIM